MKAALQEAEEAEESAGSGAIGDGDGATKRPREILSAEEKAKKEKERQKAAEVNAFVYIIGQPSITMFAVSRKRRRGSKGSKN